MGPRTRQRMEKAGFLLSLLVLVFLWGYATRGFGWFPHNLLDRAWAQAEWVNPFGLLRPHFVHDRAFDRSGVRVAQPDRIQPGLTLVSSFWEEYGWEPGLKLLDSRGRVVHEWYADYREIFSVPPLRGEGKPSIHGFQLLSGGHVLVNFNYLGTVRIDACGEPVWSRRTGSHHSIARDDDGTFWLSSIYPSDTSGAGGHLVDLPGLGRPAHQNRILQMDGDGNVLAQINVLRVLEENGLIRLVPKTTLGDTADITHLNDVEPLPEAMAEDYPLFEAGDLVVSLRHQDLVFVMDPETREVKWHASDPFIGQHDPDWMGGGWIGVFDNNRDGTDRGTLLGGSRIVAVQPHTDSTRVVFPTPSSERFYTGLGGKWQELPNGNLLLTEGLAGRVLEVAPDGSSVWEWIQEPYDRGSTVSVHEGTRHDLDMEEVGSWPCSPGNPTESDPEVAS